MKDVEGVKRFKADLIFFISDFMLDNFKLFKLYFLIKPVDERNFLFTNRYLQSSYPRIIYLTISEYSKNKFISGLLLI